jgi:hypothetical protein
LTEGLSKERDPAVTQDAVRGQVYKVSSLASGGVSIVFHVDPADTNMAMGYLHLRGLTVKLTLSET